MSSTDLPDLPTGSTTSKHSASSTSSASSSSKTSSHASSITSSASSVAASLAVTTTSNGHVYTLSNLPTIAGAGIPTLVIPYTAAAPFMQKSSLPEGTVFIAIGALLALLGACVLLWRGLIAWSINRSAKRKAMASISATNEKRTSTWGYGPSGGHYKELGGSSMSLDALTSAGKPIKPYAQEPSRRDSSNPPAGLFFSPTAQATSNQAGARNSTYLPAGYYASPSAAAAGGASATTLGGPSAPFARNSYVAPSPPISPGLPPAMRNSYHGMGSQEMLRPGSAGRDGSSSARTSYIDLNNRNSAIFTQPSSSTLAHDAQGQGQQRGESSSRAPSAYLDDMFEHHSNVPK